MINTALQIAVAAHRGQLEKNGNPYVFHPIRIMLKMPTIETKVVALLHDVVEDTTITIDYLREVFPEEITDAVMAITKSGLQTYDDYLATVKANEIARIVKLGDLEDNMDLSRIPKLSEADYTRTKKYQQAVLFLTENYIPVQ